MAFGMDMLDLKKQFTFYASYHNQPVNVLIHLLCIWPILATACLMLQVLNETINQRICLTPFSELLPFNFQYTPAFMATPDWLSSIPSFQHVKINASFVAIGIYVGKSFLSPTTYFTTLQFTMNTKLGKQSCSVLAKSHLGILVESSFI